LGHQKSYEMRNPKICLSRTVVFVQFAKALEIGENLAVVIPCKNPAELSQLSAIASSAINGYLRLSATFEIDGRELG